MAKNEDVNIYDLYIRDIYKYGTINGSQMYECLKQYHNGNAKERKVAKERLVGSLQRFVLSIAQKFASGDNIMDAISEGNIGLMKAIETYDMNSNVKFTTYATYWVRKAIMSYNTLEAPIVRPSNAIKLATYVPKVKQEFWKENSRQPTTEEIQELIAEKYQLNIINKSDIDMCQPMTIDDSYEDDEDGHEFTKENDLYTAKTATCNTDNFAKENDEKVVVQQMLSKLNDRESYIIKCIYGIDCHPKTMDAVAHEIGLSNERVRQIALHSVAKLGERCSDLADAF
jgi:RNA polymerase sigma factor (sigma-70 family)